MNAQMIANAPCVGPAAAAPAHPLATAGRALPGSPFHAAEAHHV